MYFELYSFNIEQNRFRIFSGKMLEIGGFLTLDFPMNHKDDKWITQVFNQNLIPFLCLRIMEVGNG